MKGIIALFILFSIADFGISQNVYVVSGIVTDKGNNQPMGNATVHLIGSKYTTSSKGNGSFQLNTAKWFDSLEVSSVGFETSTLVLRNGNTSGILVKMVNTPNALKDVVVSISNKSDKILIQKVIDNKAHNNPSRFHSYSYQQYTRHELDIDNVDFEKIKGKGIKSLMIQTYSNLNASAKSDNGLPIYFSEKLVNIYHSISPKIEKENIIAKKNLGLKTDQLLSKMDKFYFGFNIYDDWVPIFNQTYISPLNENALHYYKFFEGDSIMEDGELLRQIRFTPIRPYERAFNGNLWVNTSTLAVASVNMHLTKTANLNFVNDINYSEDYKQVFDSTLDRWVYMPYKLSSEVKFESGLSLLGIPVQDGNSQMRFMINNTTIAYNIKLNAGEVSEVISSLVMNEQSSNWFKSESFWQQNRPDSLTVHEQNIYKMVDSLKENTRFQRDVKLIAFAGTGYWDFGNYVRVGPYSSFLSKNPIEGWRIRLGFWTMPGISKKINLYGYGAYGNKDQKLKGLIGLKYVWNDLRWTKTSFSFGSDYDFIIDQDDELDKDNLINSLLRKPIPFTRMYTKQALLKHEQYISPDFSAKSLVSYKELNPVFNFKYRPINAALDRPYDSVFAKRLPVAETSIGIRYAHKERTTKLNYDNIHVVTYSPVLYANYTYGFELGEARFEYNKVKVGIEQNLRLPPKCLLYYKVEAGKVFGTIPYLLLNIPAGNEYYVTSKYQFNTMAPYEFASDRYLSLHTRFYLGGALLDKIPLLQKLGWRERASFNAYWGDMTMANIDYNKNSNFNLIGKAPFMEASIGIENIFHVISIDYYRRLNYLNNAYATKNGIYLGLTLSF